MSTPTTEDLEAPADTTVAPNHPDPITGEPGAHPVGVGVGAFSAGAAGAAIGSIGGPLGVVIGAAIGALAGGLAGKEVATNAEVESTPPAPLAEEPATGSSFSLPPALGAVAMPGDDFRVANGAGFAADSGISSFETEDLAGAAMPHSGEEAVRVAAYYLYVNRTETGRAGDALGDWLEAEREMMLS